MDINGNKLEGIIGPFDEYSSVILVCEAINGNPNPSLIWYHINVLEVIIDDSFTVGTNGNVQNELNLRKLDRNDFMTRLTCRASSNGFYEPITSSVIIDMNLKPLSVEILTPNRALTVGKLAQYRCRSDGSRPLAYISWFIENEIIDDVQNSAINEGNTSFSIVSFIPIPEFNGKDLICRSENVLMPNSTLEDKILLDILFPPKSEVSLNSNFSTNSIIEGKDIQIDCQIVSNPWIDEISWIFDKKKLMITQNSELINSNKSLILKNLSRNQSGKYQCLASNSIGKTISREFELSVKFSPICEVGQKLYYSVIRNVVNRIKCSVEANPIDSLEFKWFVNTSIEMFELKSFNSNSTTSIANYIPKTIMNYAIILCFAENSIGIQREPCIYKLKIENGPPESVRNCEITNKSLTIVSVQCSAGNNGGLQQTFYLEIYKTGSEQLHSNQSSSQPLFIVNNLIPKTHYRFAIYSANPKGRSNSITYTSVIIDSEEEKIAKVNPLINSLIGIVSSVVIVCICITIIIKIRSYIFEDEYKYNKKKTIFSELTSKFKDKKTAENSDKNQESCDEKFENNVLRETIESGSDENKSSSQNFRINAFKRLTNKLRATKYKTYADSGNDGYEKIPRKVVTFADFEEFLEVDEENEGNSLSDSSILDNKYEKRVTPNNSDENSSQECPQQLEDYNKCDSRVDCADETLINT